MKENDKMFNEIFSRILAIEEEMKKPKLETTQKATLEFDMTDPYAREDHWMAVNGHLAFIALNDIIEKFRQLDKYDNELVVDDRIEIEKVRKFIGEIITDRDLWRDGVL